MKFESDRIVYSAAHNWDELISISFIKDKDYLSLSTLVYEEEIGIELNDQTNYLSVLKSDFRYKLSDNRLYFTAGKAIVQNNLSDLSFEIVVSNADLNMLGKALSLLAKQAV